MKVNKQQFIQQFREKWGSDHYKNFPLDTVLYSYDEHGNHKTAEIGMYKTCFTVEGIEEQLNNFTHDVGLLWFFDPESNDIMHMAVDKRELS